MILGQLGLAVGPLLAGAGVVGVAIGFGSQNLVRDVISGVFMLIEDQYGVGDVIDTGPASGVVEGITLRTTQIRDVRGTLWHVPNGRIERVGNMSQLWSRALLDIEVAYATDLGQARRVIKDVADTVWRDANWAHKVLEEPEIWGVEVLGSDGISIRLVVKTAPLAQWDVSRELRERLKVAFDDHGIEIPFPQRVVWHRNENGERAVEPPHDERPSRDPNSSPPHHRSNHPS
jgi:small conductance mechanosensitive channel